MKKFIFTENKKLFNKVLAIALTAVVIIALVTSVFVVDSFAIANPKCYHKFFLSTFNGSYDAEDMPSSYWDVKVLKDEESGKNFKVKAKVELPITSDKFLGQVWINVSDLAGDKIEIFTYHKTTEKVLNKNDKPVVITAKDVKNSNDGWFKIYDFNDVDNFDKSYGGIKNYSITFSTSFRIREMVFIDSEYELIKNISVINEYMEGHKYDKNTINPIKNAVDESKYFDMSKVTK